MLGSLSQGCAQNCQYDLHSVINIPQINNVTMYDCSGSTNDCENKCVIAAVALTIVSINMRMCDCSGSTNDCEHKWVWRNNIMKWKITFN